jgi:hypothetical protein
MPPVPQAGSYRLPTIRLGQVLLADEQDADHQPDDLARREVLAGGLVRLLGEAADQLLCEQGQEIALAVVGVVQQPVGQVEAARR